MLRISKTESGLHLVSQEIWEILLTQFSKCQAADLLNRPDVLPTVGAKSIHVGIFFTYYYYY